MLARTAVTLACAGLLAVFAPACQKDDKKAADKKDDKKADDKKASDADKNKPLAKRPGREKIPPPPDVAEPPADAKKTAPRRPPAASSTRPSPRASRTRRSRGRTTPSSCSTPAGPPTETCSTAR
jgi:hypothetical protein